MPSEFERVKQIFLAAAERTDPLEREDCLRQACEGDEELRRRVEALLRRHEQSGSPLDRPAFEPPANSVAQLNDFGGQDAPRETAGERIGPYKLLQRIGEGGMGAVWMAEQREPVRRLVALKVVRGDLDRAQGVARFEAERQALALMDHPHIAKVLDAGATADNRPYFVMELVKGTLITEYCDKHRLTPRQRLELFVPVCQALQHAHQKGIIHRDIKPSNVLVAPYDGRPVVKVIDFGVAKAVGPRLTERTLFTEFGTVVGTLEYMSPEQAELNNQDIDTRSDVYSLGVLLYELLTGTTPLTTERLKKTAFLELLWAIREEEPPRPSTRLSDSQAALSSISASRQTEPAKLRKLLLGELDWIVMKALEKDRGRRYQTANALARDVERYLNDETVEARPPSPGYRMGKILRRNKRPAAAVAGILTALVVGLVGTLIFAVGEAEQRRRAGLNARLAEQEKNGALYQAYRGRLAAAGAALQDHDVADAARQLKEAPEAFRDWEWHCQHSRLDDSSGSMRLRPGDPALLLSGPKGLRVGTFTKTGLCLVDESGDASPERPFPNLGNNTYSVAQAAEGWWLATAENSGLLTLRDETGRVLRSIKPEAGHIACIALNSDKTRVAVVLQNQTEQIIVYDVSSGEVCARSDGLPRQSGILTFNPDGTRLATGGDGSVVRLWDAATARPILECQGHTSKVLCIAFRRDGSRLLTASHDGKVRQWDARTGREVEPPYDRHAAAVSAVVYSDDGQRVASAGADRTIRIWWAAGRQDQAVLHGHSGGVERLAFSRDGRRLVSASYELTNSPAEEAVRFWEAGPEATLPVLAGHTSYVYPVAYSPDGRWIASGAWDNTIRLWDAVTGEACATLPHPGIVRALTFSEDSTWLLGGGDFAGGLLRWDVATGQLIGRILGRCENVRTLAINPDGTRVAVGSYNPTIGFTMSVSDIATGKEVGAWAGTPFAFSPDGKWLAGRGKDDGEKNVVLWDARTFQPVAYLQGHAGSINAIAFSMDGRRFVSASSDRTVRLWDAETEQCLRVFVGHTDIVFAAAYHPSGTRIASAGRDGRIWLWDVATGLDVARLQGHTNYVYSLAFSPDGGTLVSGSGDTNLRLWGAEPLRVRYRAQRAGETLRPKAERLVEERLREKKDSREVAATLRADRTLEEPLRHAALRALQRRQSR